MDLNSILDKFIGKSFKSRKFLLALLALILVTPGYLLEVFGPLP
jgi:hypothetical protein